MTKSILITVVIYYWYSLEIRTYSSSKLQAESDETHCNIASKYLRVPVKSSCKVKNVGCSFETHEYTTYSALDRQWIDGALCTNFSLEFQFLLFLNQKQVPGKEYFVESTQSAAEKWNITNNRSWYEASTGSFLYIIAGVLLFDMFAGMSVTSLGARQHSSSMSVDHPELKPSNDLSNNVPVRVNRAISRQNSLFHTDLLHTDFGKPAYNKGMTRNDDQVASAVNKLWFAIPNASYSSKRRQPHFAAFLAYCHNDSDFVVNKLYEPLQKYLSRALPQWSPDSLTLLYDKHFLPGQPLDEICRAAVYNSYVTIAIISDSFIQSPWCLYEMENAVTANVPVIPLYLTRRDITCFSGIMKHVYDKHVRTFWPKSPKMSDSMTNEEIDTVSEIGFSVLAYIKESASETSQRNADQNNNNIMTKQHKSENQMNGGDDGPNYDTISNLSISGQEENDITKYNPTLDNNVCDYEEIDDVQDTIRQSTMKRPPKQML